MGRKKVVNLDKRMNIEIKLCLRTTEAVSILCYKKQDLFFNFFLFLLHTILTCKVNTFMLRL